MNPMEQLKARTQYAIREAEKASLRRSRREEREEEEDAQEEGRTVAVRPWTRFVFSVFFEFEVEGMPVGECFRVQSAVVAIGNGPLGAPLFGRG